VNSSSSPKEIELFPHRTQSQLCLDVGSLRGSRGKSSSARYFKINGVKILKSINASRLCKTALSLELECFLAHWFLDPPSEDNAVPGPLYQRSRTASCARNLYKGITNPTTLPPHSVSASLLLLLSIYFWTLSTGAQTSAAIPSLAVSSMDSVFLFCVARYPA
jgi:hypothetical protein